VMFTQDIARYCDDETGGVFTMFEGHLAISPDWVRGMTVGDVVLDTLGCLIKVTTIAGLKLYFIGNEKLREPAEEE